MIESSFCQTGCVGQVAIFLHGSVDEEVQVNGISVRVEDKEILHDINLEIGKGETHVLMGPNGAGKSTLGYALMGNLKYEVTKGDIIYHGNRINEDGADKRAGDGIFLSFQSPLEVPGLSLSSFIRNAVEKRRGSRIRLWDFKKKLQKEMAPSQATAVQFRRLPRTLCWI